MKSYYTIKKFNKGLKRNFSIKVKFANYTIKKFNKGLKRASTIQRQQYKLYHKKV